MDNVKLDKILKDFYIISGMDISILDSRFHTISVARCPSENLCSFIHRALSTAEICKSSDIEHLIVAQKSEEPITYTCPFGITEAIVPIKRGDSIMAYVIATMGIKQNNEDSVFELCHNIVPSLDTVRLSELVERIKTLTDGEAEAYFNQLIMIAEHIGNDTTLSKSEESIGTLVKYFVKNNLSRKLSLSDIAFNLHCSTVTLTEHFKAEFGITITEYIRDKRMQLSKKLLIATDEPLREVALASGFADVEYFSRTFKKYHGISPAAWRKANK